MCGIHAHGWWPVKELDNLLYSSSLYSLKAETESFLKPGARQVASSLICLPISSLHSSVVTVMGGYAHFLCKCLEFELRSSCLQRTHLFTLLAQTLLVSFQTMGLSRLRVLNEFWMGCFCNWISELSQALLGNGSSHMYVWTYMSSKYYFNHFWVWSPFIMCKHNLVHSQNILYHLIWKLGFY